MGKENVGDLLKRRMAATQRASELENGNAAYEKLYQLPPEPVAATICILPLDKLVPFFTADIGFKLYPKPKLEAFARQLAEEGLMVRIIVRPIPGTDRYEILAGHNRVAAARLAGWTVIPSEVVEVTDDRAIVIATSTNLIQRQDLSVIERGKAYKALLEAKNRNGQWYGKTDEPFGDNRQRVERTRGYNARAIVAEIMGVTEYEIRKAIKLTMLIPELQAIIEDRPKQLNLACAELIADYDAESQKAFVEMCSVEGYQINKAAVQHIMRACPPPSAQRNDLFAAWRAARAKAERKMGAPPRKIAFDRARFAPYLDKLGSDAKVEEMFLEFLRERVKL